MMRMKQRITSLILFACLTVMLAGCDETLNFKKGDQLRFTVTAVEGPGTKTSYAGYTAGTKYERIEWVAGDPIRIFSMNPSIVSAKWSDNTTGHDYYDYVILQTEESPIENVERESRAHLKKPAEGYGMVWVDSPEGATFYGVYPKAEPQYKSETEPQIVAFQGMTILATQQGAQPDMGHAYMVSAPAQYASSTEDMKMRFYPFFNAFYIELKSEDSDIKINSVTLSAAENSSTNLAGNYKYLFLENNGIPAVGNVTYNYSDVTKSVTADLSSMSDADRTASKTHAVAVTLLTLPPTNSEGLTNMTLTVNYDDNQQKSLALNDNVTSANPTGTPIKFKPFYKTRITGLAMKGGSTWQLDIYTDVNKWTVYEKETSFSTQIGCDQWKDPNDQNKSLMVQGMWETGNHYADITGTVNGTSGYSKYYQIRTLKDDYFIVKFRPYAPVGGYWRVTPWFQSGDTASPDKFEILVFEEGDKPGEGTYSTDLTGQIMGNWVELHIKPKNYDPQEDDGVYVMMLHCDFSTSKTFDEGTYYSVDSEFQDVHGDGRYSYWRFTLDKSYTGGN